MNPGRKDDMGNEATRPAFAAEPERMRLKRAVWGGPCPDPKGWRCDGIVKRVHEVLGGDPDQYKHPMDLMCPRCKARFDRDGRWTGWRAAGLSEEPLYDAAPAPAQEAARCPADEEIPW